MMRKCMVAGNWKMYKTPQEASVLAGKTVDKIGGLTGVDIVVCPAFVSLTAVYEIIKNSQIRLGAQNLCYEDEGAFTGEVSAPMLKEIGCKHVICGHSERRTLFGEDDEAVNRKARACLKWNLPPIICVGETLGEREAGNTGNVVRKQLEGALAGISEEEMLKAVVAYEPVWAIGTGKTASPEQAGEVHGLIRSFIDEKYSEKCGSSIKILYGGSVKPDNIRGLMEYEDIDGALVGGASLDANSFSEIVNGSIRGESA